MVAPDYPALRRSYEASPQFDPAGVRTATQRKAMREASAANDFQTMVEKAAIILEEHFTDIDANITSAFAYLQLGKPQLKRKHDDIALGLLAAIMDGKDGKSLDQAFEVISIPEQFAVFEALRLTPGPTRPPSQSGYRHLSVEATDRAGVARTIHFQVDRMTAGLGVLEFFQLRFPHSVGGFERAGVVSFEKEKPGLGYSVKYHGKGWAISVIIYDRGVAAIPELTSKTVRDELERARIEVAQIHRTIFNASRKFSVKAVDDTDRFLCTTLSTGTSPNAEEYLCLTGWRGKFVKFRVTSPRGDGTDEPMKILLHAWMKVLWPELDADVREMQTAFARGDFVAVAKLAPPLADRGDPRAQFTLGFLYKNGVGVTRDLVRAYVFVSLAAAAFPDAERDAPPFGTYLRGITAKMSDREIKEAKKQVDDWKAKSGVPRFFGVSANTLLASPSAAVSASKSSDPWRNIPTQIQQPKAIPKPQESATGLDPKLDLKKLNLCRGC